MAADSNHIVEQIVKLNTITRDLINLMEVEKSEDLDLEKVRDLYAQRGELIDELTTIAKPDSESTTNLWDKIDSEYRDKAQRLYTETMQLDQQASTKIKEHLDLIEKDINNNSTEKKTHRTYSKGDSEGKDVFITSKLTG